MRSIQCLRWILLGFLWCLSMVAVATYAEPVVETERILTDLAEKYAPKAPDSLSLVVQFKVDGSLWHVVVEPEKNVTVHRGRNDSAAFVFTLSEETLRRIYQGKMTAMTAGGKASGADTAPLEMEPTESAASIPGVRGVILGFLQHFFNPSTPERILLGERYSRVVHGAHVIPLYYAPGFRSAWYTVAQGQRLNEPGDTNPFPQALVIISGRGFAKIGDETIPIRAGESYFIPPNSDHVVWTEGDEPVVIVWMGWGEGA